MHSSLDLQEILSMHLLCRCLFVTNGRRISVKRDWKQDILLRINAWNQTSADLKLCNERNCMTFLRTVGKSNYKLIQELTQFFRNSRGDWQVVGSSRNQNGRIKNCTRLFLIIACKHTGSYASSTFSPTRQLHYFWYCRMEELRFLFTDFLRTWTELH